MTSIEIDAARQHGWFRRFIIWLVEGFSLRRRIVLVLALAALPGIVVAFALAANKLTEQTQQIETNVARLARLGMAQNDAVLDQAHLLLASTAKLLESLPSGVDKCSLLRPLPQGFAGLTAPVLFDASGVVICAPGDDKMAFGGSGQSWFEKAIKAKTFTLGDYSVIRDGKPMLVAAYPIEKGARNEVLALGVDLHWLDFIASSIKLPKSMTISAMNHEGRLLTNNSAMTADEGTPEAAPPSQTTRQTIAKMTEGTLRGQDTSGSPRVYGIAETSLGGLIIAVGSPRYYDFVRYSDALVDTLLAPLAILILALVAAGWAAEVFVTRHVRSLTQTAERISAGDFSARTSVPYDEHEIGDLADAFDDMAETVESEHGTLRAGVSHRDVLIRELNHRVKNDLQTVLSMLELERREITSENSTERLESLSGRVRTLAEAHRLLLEDSNEGVPLLGRYTRNLVELLATFYGSRVGSVRVSSDIAMETLDVTRLVSYGLVLNELISNAQKHAFPGGRSGVIKVSLKSDVKNDGNPDYGILTVQDDGVGLPKDLDFASNHSNGMRIVRGLVRQLGGEVRARKVKKGTAIEVRFPLSAVKSAADFPAGAQV